MHLHTKASCHLMSLLNRKSSFTIVNYTLQVVLRMITSRWMSGTKSGLGLEFGGLGMLRIVSFDIVVTMKK